MTKALIFGLDGATFHVLDALVAEGVMPNLAAFLKRAARGLLTSTVPPLTPTAWSSLVTGRSPGHHGVTGFFQYESPESLALRIVSSRELRSETIWAVVNRHGLRAASLNFPVHCPPPRIDGYVIPGWVPWKWIKRFSHPPGFVDRLTRELPGFDIRQLAMDFEQEKKSIAGAPIDDYEAWIGLHLCRDRQWFGVLRHLVASGSCELAGVVFDGVDKLQHLLWPHLDPARKPGSESTRDQTIHALCRDYFRQLDTFLGDLLRLAGPECSVFIVSDHGFTGTDEILYINTWLEREGYLRWKDGAKAVAEDCQELEPDFYSLSAFDLTRTTAFALTASSNGIHIVVRGKKTPEGVPPERYLEFRSRLARDLRARCVHPETGESLIARVWTREEVFSGPAMEIAPDLTLTLRDHGFVSVRRSSRLVSRRPQTMGTHHPDGILIAAGPGIRGGHTIDSARLLDIAPTILYALGLPVPANIEGEVVQDLFTAAHLRANPIRLENNRQELARAAAEPLPPDDGEILERLKALGYLE